MSHEFPINPSNSIPSPDRLDNLNGPETTFFDVLGQAGFGTSDPYTRLAKVSELTIDDLNGIIDQVHRKVAPEADDKPSFVARTIGEGASAQIAANPADRQAILEDALMKSKCVIDKLYAEGGDVQEAANRSADLIGFGIVLAHSYEDGNGRTSRTIGGAIMFGADSSNVESAMDLSVMAKNRPEDGFRITSYAPTQDWSEGRANRDPHGFLNAVAALDVPLDKYAYDQYITHIANAPRTM